MSPEGDLPVELRFCCFDVWTKRADLLALEAVVGREQVAFLEFATSGIRLFETGTDTVGT